MEPSSDEYSNSRLSMKYFKLKEDLFLCSCVLIGKSSTKYAQIDITATETAHKVGTQHALGRQEGLHTLELRRKGTPH